MHQSRFLIFCFLIFGFALTSNILQAQTDVNSTVALSGKLNKLGMFELSFYLLDKEMNKDPQGRDKIKVQKAETYFAMRQEDKGMNILNGLSSTSPAYTFSRLVLGKHLWQARKFKEAAAQFEKYFALILYVD